MVRPFYDEEGITIYHGNALELAEHLSADSMITDPPYGINKDSEWDREFLLPPKIAGVSTIFITPGTSNIGRMPETLHGLTYRWTLAAHLINGMALGTIGYANWIPCLLYSSDSVNLFHRDGDCKDFTIISPKPDHPSPKPINAWRWLVSRLPGEVLIDPFIGSGTTLIAAKEQGRRAIGIEISERYCELAAKRLAQRRLPFPEKPTREQANLFSIEPEAKP